MDYLKPKYNLKTVKELLSKDKYKISSKVKRDASYYFNFSTDEIINVLMQLERKHFYKSMDSTINRKIRQDVYRFPYANRGIYIKFQLTPDNQCYIMLMSFKEKK
jgi:hypothetical protein